MKAKAIEYARKACDTMMTRFEAADLPPKGGFHYHAGVFLSGMLNVYSVCQEEAYFEYTKKWVDSIIIEEGVIRYFSKGALDSYMAGNLLFPLYERSGEQKYMTALQLFAGNIRNWVRNEMGGFWHMEWMPDQMWLDGLYMAGPLQARFTKFFKKQYFLDEAINQAILMYENMQDPETKLLYHAWDYSKEMEWADKKTGLSKEFWGRAMGWYVVAMLDILELMPKEHPQYNRMVTIEQELLKVLIPLQNEENGMWYQVLDKQDKTDNWPETSCSCLFVYSIAKAVRMSLLDKKFLKNVEKGFEGILKHSVEITDNELLLKYTCIGTGVCDYDGYISRPTSINDLHGMGAFLLMCAELARIESDN